MIKEIVWENSILFHSRNRNDKNCFQIIAQLSMFNLVYFDCWRVFSLIILKEGRKSVLSYLEHFNQTSLHGELQSTVLTLSPGSTGIVTK